MKKTIKIMTVAMILLAFLLGGCTQTAAVAPQNLATIMVDASSYMEVLPDQGEIYVTVLTRGDTDQVQGDNAVLADEVIAAIVAAGVSKEDIETSSIDFYPTYTYDKDTYKSEIDGYEARHRLSVTIMDLDIVGKVIDEAVAAGAEYVDGVNFTVSEEKKEEYKKTLIEEAVAKAKVKADAAAGASGESIDGVQTLSVSDYNPQPYYRADAVIGKGGAEETPVLPGEVRVEISVHIAYRLK
jgi:hypothetical protein